jgi:lysophospholipase L1-like esterase
VLSESDIDSDAAFTRIAGADRRNGRLESFYLYRLVKFVGAKIGVIGPNIGSNLQLTVDKLKPRVSAESYRANLIKMVEWARAHGSLPYFILLGDNPNRSKLLQRGKLHFEHGEYEQAIEDLELVTQYAHSTVAILARKYLSRAYMATKQSDKVMEAQAVREPFYSLTGGYPIVEDSVYNEIMRDVARQYSVPLIDAKSRLEQSPWVFFDDANHFDAEGHEIVGGLISEALSR